MSRVDWSKLNTKCHEVHFDLPPDTHHAMHLICRSRAGKVIASCQLQNWHTDTPSLCWLYVEPKWRRCGVGRGMVQMAIGECRHHGKNSLTLTVSRQNPHAEDLYRQEGFTHYQQDDDNVYFVKLLKGRA